MWLIEERFDDFVFIGYLIGVEDYFKYDCCFGVMCGIDFCDNMNFVNYIGVYFIYLFV